MKFSMIIVLWIACGLLGCTREQTFPDIKDNIAGPADIALSANKSYFYVLNGDFDRTYNKGSLVVMDLTGKKVATVELPRLGNSMRIAGTRGIITTQEDEGVDAQVILLDLSDEADPKITKKLSIDCDPAGNFFQESYDLFAVACRDGDIYVGEFGALKLHHIRSYGFARRAMYIHPTKELLYLFPTDSKGPQSRDEILDDKFTYATDGTSTPEANEIPDVFERTALDRAEVERRYPFQVAIVDLTKLKSENFKYKDLRDQEAANDEIFMLYFTLNEGPGVAPPLDSHSSIVKEGQKLYRTSFWDAKNNTEDGSFDSFYLSQRDGFGESDRMSNNVILVTVEGAPDAQKTIDQLLSFERIYGFEGDIPTKPYMNDFAVQVVAGKKLVVANHFRDFATFKVDDNFRFSLGYKNISDSSDFMEIGGQSASQSFYQFVINEDGLGAACAFYNNAVLLFQLTPGSAIKVTRTIK